MKEAPRRMEGDKSIVTLNSQCVYYKCSYEHLGEGLRYSTALHGLRKPYGNVDPQEYIYSGKEHDTNPDKEHDTNTMPGREHDTNTMPGREHDTNTMPGREHDTNTMQGREHDTNTMQGREHDTNTIPGKKRRKRRLPRSNKLSENELKTRNWIQESLLECKHLLKDSLAADFTKYDEDLRIYQNNVANNEFKEVDFKLFTDIADSTRKFRMHDKSTIFTCHEHPEVDSYLFMYTRLFENNKEDHCVVNICGRRYVIPSRCLFLMSNIDSIDILYEDIVGKQYELIIMDPPWPNRSVERQYLYHLYRSRNHPSLNLYSVLKIPIRKLALEGGYVGIWVVNNYKIKKFVTETLLNRWKLRLIEKFLWVKITQDGKPAINLLSDHRYPYEMFILAVKLESDYRYICSPVRQRIIFSVPSSIHSSKPILNDLLQQYVPLNANKLELFARNLLPGWTSWGNEVLKLCDDKYIMGK